MSCKRCNSGFLRKIDIWIYDRPCLNKRIICFKASLEEVGRILNNKH